MKDIPYKKNTDISMEDEKILKKYSKEENTRISNNIIKKIINVISFSLSIFLLYTGFFGQLPALRQRSLFLLAVMVLSFILYPMNHKNVNKPVPWYDYIFALLSLVICSYVFLSYESILLKMGISEFKDQIANVILVVLILEATRRLVSKALAGVTIVFLVYAYFGNYMPGIFRIKAGSIFRLTNHLFMIPEGIFSIPLGAAATFISLFVIFSTILSKSGLGVFIQDIALALTGHTSGGPAKVAVFASACFGTISGQAASNVVTTGAFTIPLMKRVGYSPEFSAATEACASTGGQLIPPVLGAACFIMSEYIGVPYGRIMLTAIVPGFLFYLSTLLTVHYRAKKLGLNGIPKNELPDPKKALYERGHLLIPFIITFYLIIRQYTISYAALWGIVLSIVVAQSRKTTRMSFMDIISALTESGTKVVSFGVACACVGIIIGVTTLTGVGVILGNYILMLSKGYLLFSLILVMIMSIIMGMGMPTVAVYMVLATVAAPIMVKMGIPIIAAHFFCFYFGILACITPPVAVPSYAAAALAGANPGAVGWGAMKMALPSFIIPFVFVYEPSLIFVNYNLPTFLVTFITTILGIYMMVFSFERYIFKPLSFLKSAILFVMAIFTIIPEWRTDVIGVSFFGLIIISEYVVYKKNKIEKKMLNELEQT